MSTIKFAQVIIHRDPMTKIPKEVLPWEVPIYRAQYGDEKVEILGEVEREYEALEPAEEYSRLRQQFGIEPDTKQSFADIVYGRGAAGVDALEKAMKAGKSGKLEAKVEGAQKVVDGGKPDKDKAEAREAAYRDPLDDEFLGKPTADAGEGAAEKPAKK